MPPSGDTEVDIFVPSEYPVPYEVDVYVNTLAKWARVIFLSETTNVSELVVVVVPATIKLPVISNVSSIHVRPSTPNVPVNCPLPFTVNPAKVGVAALCIFWGSCNVISPLELITFI